MNNFRESLVSLVEQDRKEVQVNLDLTGFRENRGAEERLGTMELLGHQACLVWMV